MAKEIRCDCSRCKKNCESRTGFCSNFEPIYTTNADRIRTMTDEELAEFFAIKSPCNYYCNYIGKTCIGVSCKQGILEWLQSEVGQEGKV